MPPNHFLYGKLGVLGDIRQIGAKLDVIADWNGNRRRIRCSDGVACALELLNDSR